MFSSCDWIQHTSWEVSWQKFLAQNSNKGTSHSVEPIAASRWCFSSWCVISCCLSPSPPGDMLRNVEITGEWARECDELCMIGIDELLLLGCKVLGEGTPSGHPWTIFFAFWTWIQTFTWWNKKKINKVKNNCHILKYCSFLEGT